MRQPTLKTMVLSKFTLTVNLSAELGRPTALAT
jgi:hypothetical protein